MVIIFEFGGAKMSPWYVWKNRAGLPTAEVIEIMVRVSVCWTLLPLKRALTSLAG